MANTGLGMTAEQDLIASDIDAYLTSHQYKSLLRFITCGSVDDGTYTFSIEGLDGGAVDVQTLVVGTVTEMDYGSGVPQPSIEGVVVGIDAIQKLTAAEEAGS